MAVGCCAARRDAGCPTLLLCFCQPLCLQLPSCKWLCGSQLVSSICEVVDKYAKDFSRVRKPVCTVRLLRDGLRMAACLRGEEVGRRSAVLGYRRCGRCWVAGEPASSGAALSTPLCR